MQPRIFFRATLVVLIVVTLVSISNGQHRRSYPTPPSGALSEDPAPSQPKYSTHRLDGIAMEREAKELSTLATSIPDDVEQLKKGLLPSDAFEKLKRIEKLSKQLRNQMRP